MEPKLFNSNQTDYYKSVNQILEKAYQSIIIEKPTELVNFNFMNYFEKCDFMLEWLRKEKLGLNKQPQLFQFANRTPQIDQQCFAGSEENAQSQQSIQRRVPKSQEQKQQIQSVLVISGIFKNFSKEVHLQLIDALEFQNFPENEIIFEEGSTGKNMYLIISGTIQCIKSPDQLLRVYTSSGYFGELSLLYNTPRNASIISETDCKLLALDKESLEIICKKLIVEKRNSLRNLLVQVEGFDNLEEYDREIIADTIEIEIIKPGDTIIKEGEAPDYFYIILEGQGYATKNEEIVMQYNEFMYFGEVALLKQTKRQATVVAQTKMKLGKLKSEEFLDLLAPLEQYFRNSFRKYKNFS